MTVTPLRAAGKTRVAVIGAGMIGRSWAVTFARGGCEVALYDPAADVADAALPAIDAILSALAGADLLGERPTAEVRARIEVAPTLALALDNATHVQENAPETLAIKRAVFVELDAAAPPDAVIASSSSALLPSAFTQGLPGAHRCLVAHPLNPPHLIPAVEIVPSPTTSAEAIEATRALMTSIGQTPIVARREIAGFVMNRLQGAILDEAFALVAGGYAQPADVDAAMRDGLARRWSFMGPFETIDLNAPGGIAGFIERYGDAYAEIGADRPNRPAWQGELAEHVVAARREALPANALADRQRWRDARLMALAMHLQTQSETE